MEEITDAEVIYGDKVFDVIINNVLLSNQLPALSAARLDMYQCTINERHTQVLALTCPSVC